MAGNKFGGTTTGRDYGSPCVWFVDFRLKVIHRVLGVVMVRFFAAAGDSCKAKRSLLVFLTMN